MTRPNETGMDDSGSPFSLMRQLSDEMSRVIHAFGFGADTRGDLDTSAREWGSWAPPVDVFRRGDRLVVRTDLPGLSRDDINVEVRGRSLLISGERRDELSDEREGYVRHERSYGAFSRTVPLPEGVDPDDAKARFENGVLEVTVRSREEPEGRRRLRIE